MNLRFKLQLNFIKNANLKFGFSKRDFSFWTKPILTQPILKSNTLDAVASHIKERKCQNILVLTGAGISVSAGIPDFRFKFSIFLIHRSSDGLYRLVEKELGFAEPEAIFDITVFNANPKPFYKIMKHLLPNNFNPTPTHHFIKLLHDKGLLLRNYTQNIDGLEYKAGIPSNILVEAHGTLRTAHCLACRTPHSIEDIQGHLYQLNAFISSETIVKGNVPSCKSCGKEKVKPDVVFFKEMLPFRFYELSEGDFRLCDLLLVMGTSLQVYPFAGLVDKVPINTPRLVINNESVGREFFDFESKFYRDVQLISDCDSAVVKFAELLGWKHELKELIEGKRIESPK